MRQNGRQFHESVARRKLKWQDFYYNSRISSDMQYCNKSLFYTPKTGYKMPSLQGFHFYNNINIYCKYKPLLTSKCINRIQVGRLNRRKQTKDDTDQHREYYRAYNRRNTNGCR